MRCFAPPFRYLEDMTGKLPKDAIEDSYPDPVPPHPDDAPPPHKRATPASQKVDWISGQRLVFLGNISNRAETRLEEAPIDPQEKGVGHAGNVIANQARNRSGLVVPNRPQGFVVAG